MLQGTVKFYNRDNRYGFIKPDGEGDDVFFHINDCGGLTELNEGQTVSYEVTTDPIKNKTKAINVAIVE